MAVNRKTQEREKRLKWFRDARFGMFIHYGIYAQLGRGEWVWNRDRVPYDEYVALADTWQPKRGCARAWARLAKAAGMKYMVLTTKHHDGFCLWDTAQTDFNAVRHGPGRDIVAEYADACRSAGLKVGLYYSLADWHHPDGWRCWADMKARQRFVKFTHGCVRELMSNYGKIDVLWYDGGWPLDARGWQSRKLNRMVRDLQPDILINDRSLIPEDFDTSEGAVTPKGKGRPWEACMTYLGSWGWLAWPPDDWYRCAQIVEMLRTASNGQGNLRLNIGPRPDGSVLPVVADRLKKAGRWLGKNGDAVLPHMDSTAGRFEWNAYGQWSAKGNSAYLWVTRWLGPEIAVGGFRGKVKRVTILASGRELPFEQTFMRLVIKGLPPTNPDKLADTCVLKIECASKPRQENGPLAVYVNKAAPRKWLEARKEKA